jgi:hypothetical protein
MRLIAYHIAPILNRDWLLGDVCIITFPINMFSCGRVLINFANLVILQLINAYIMHMSSTGMFSEGTLTTSWRTKWLVDFKAKGKPSYSPHND